MANHPNRGKLSRNALELVATFSAGGITLTRPQQYAIGSLCRAALTVSHVAVERCNGPTTLPVWGGGRMGAPGEWQEAWEAGLDKRHAAAERRIADAIKELPHVLSARIGGDPRGCVVKLVMAPEYERMHDDWGREGVCVPGS